MCGSANTPQFGIISNQNLEDMEMNLKDMLPNIFGGGSKKRKMKVGDAFDYLVQEEEGRLIDMDQVNRVAVERVESSGIIFWTRLTRLPGARAGMGRTFRARACSATFCRSWKARR
jgi:ATP-dependent HslUV protease ATP-binding subunit HslU